MKQNISIEWWHDNKDDVQETHKNEFEEHAIERISEMTKEGYNAGELNHEIEGIYYNGWWEIK